MFKLIGLRDTWCGFARVIRAVKASFILRRGGQSVHRAVGSARGATVTQQEMAWRRTQERMRKGWSLNAGKLDRDALHDRDAMRRELLRDAK